jgi:hypothetical protein
MQFGLFPHHGGQSDRNENVECKAACVTEKRAKSIFSYFKSFLISQAYPPVPSALKAFISGACEPC